MNVSANNSLFKFGRGKGVLLFLTVILLGALLSPAAQVNAEMEVADDLSGHWAESVMREWVADERLNGYEEGVYLPDRAITRGEMIALINRSFELTDQGEVSFDDLRESDWIFKDISIAIEAGYVEGYGDDTIRWRNAMTREEAAVMVAKLLGIVHEADASVLDQFVDVSLIASWSLQAIAALVEAELLTGYPDDSIQAKRLLTRAESVTLLHKALDYAKSMDEFATAKAIFDEAGEYGPETGLETIDGNVIVNAAGVTLRNMIIEGDLIIGEDVGEGDAHFYNVEVRGTTEVRGGGADSIYFENSVLVKLIVDKRDGSVRVVASGATKVMLAVVQSPVKLEESLVTDSGFADVELSETLPAGSEVELQGQFETLSVLSSEIRISIPSGSVNEVNVGENAESTELDLGAEVTVMQLVLNAVAKVVGQGAIEQATIHEMARESSFETPPAKTDGEGADQEETPPPAPPTPPPTSPPTEPDPQVTEPQLTSLQIGDLTLVHSETGNEGLQPGSGYQGYHVPGIRSESPVTIPVTWEISGASELMYTATALPSRNIIVSGNTSTTNGTFDVTIEPGHDIQIFIQVVGSDKRSYYSINVNYPANIQEAFKIHRTRMIDHYAYSLIMDRLGGREYNHNSDIRIEVFAEEDDNQFLFSCSYSCLPYHHQPEESGSWYIKFFHHDELIAEGSYEYDYELAYDFTEMLEEDSPVIARAFTKQELADDGEIWNDDIQYSYGYSLTVDGERIKTIIEGAEYVSSFSEVVFDSQSEYPTDWVKEFLKSRQPSPLYDRTSDMYTVYGYPYDSDGKVVHDRLHYLVYHDENLEVLGYSVHPIVFDENTISDGYTATQYWQPDGGYGDGIDPDYSGGGTLPICEDDSEACRDARLIGMTATMAGHPVELNQLNEYRENSGEVGFDSEVLGYTIIADWNDVEENRRAININVEGPEYASVYYHISDMSSDERVDGGFITSLSPSFDVDFDIEPNKDYHVSISITSGDGIARKWYDIYIVYPRNIQQGFQLVSDTSYYDSQSGDYWLIKGTLDGYIDNFEDLSKWRIEIFRAAEDEGVEGEEPIYICHGGYDCPIPNYIIDELSHNHIYLKVFYEEQSFKEGIYQFNHSTVAELDQHDEQYGFAAHGISKQQLADISFEIGDFISHGSLIKLDSSILANELSEARYYSVWWEGVHLEQSTYRDYLEYEHFKQGLNPLRSHSFGFSWIRSIPAGNVEEPATIWNVYFHHSYEGDKKVDDLIFYIALLDENMKPLGYVVLPLVYTEETVGEGFTPTNLWKGN